MLVTREFLFDAAHNIPDYCGKCEKLHGHTYRLRVTVNAMMEQNGIAFDFADLKKIVNESIIDILDHSYINDHITPPTAEGIALWVWKVLQPLLPIYEIVVYETPTSWVTYRGEIE